MTRCVRRLVFSCVLAAVPATPCWPQGIDEPVRRGYVHDLQITNVAPVGPAMVEHEPIDVSYTLVVTPYGIVGAAPPLTPLRVCPSAQSDPSGCKEIGIPRLRRRYAGTIRTSAPAAAASARVRLVVMKAPPPPPAEDFGWTEVAEQSRPTPIAARYEVAIEGFQVFHTRSSHEDTIRINLQSMIKTEPPLPTHVSDTDSACRLAGIRWCDLGVAYGNVNDGVHPVDNVRAGPFLLTPEIESELRVLYTLYNFGESYTQALGEAIANGFSKAGMIVLMASATTGSSAASSLNAAMEDLHAAMFAGCDGTTAVDVVVIRNQAVKEAPEATLDALTRDTGVYRPPAAKHYQERDGNTACGAGGDYTVTYAVRRTSWRP